MPTLNIKPTHRAIKEYYESLQQLSLLHITHELAIRDAFQQLLSYCAKQVKWTLVPEFPFKRPKRHPLRIDGALIDIYNLPHGWWEAKDEQDDLEQEVKNKFEKGYPKDNILFQSPERAILYQGGRQILDESLTQPKLLVDVLQEFFRWEPPQYEQWNEAVESFKDRIPDLAEGLVKLIGEQKKTNKAFITAFQEFSQMCRTAINPNLADEAVEEMLIQHLLTERIFRKVFDNPDFVNKNAVAHEIEKVIAALTSQSFSRRDFLKGLDRFYGAIENTAATIDDYTTKQTFLNTVYEKFFQGFSVKVADTHGIVYTPQPIVDFMVRSVEEVLKKEFGKSLSDKNVHIIDPFVGTGNFITRIMREIKGSALPYKYENELHCNEVMLLPYYIANMNIEHEFFELSGQYKPFTGACLVDTFELAENKEEFDFFTADNTEKVNQQRETSMFVIIGNPPYNAGQVNENDNNKNRKYPVMDNRVSETYAKDSKATLLNKLQDPYVKAIRWASDRIGEEGVVALITNNSFVEQIAFDGMRKHLDQEFDKIYILDLGGNVRKNPKLSGTTHNVFGIQVGVSINIFIKTKPYPAYSKEVEEGIHKTPGVCGGSACIAQTRIPVWSIILKKQIGISDNDILSGYPSLSIDHIQKALQYYKGHKKEIDSEIVENSEDIDD